MKIALIGTFSAVASYTISALSHRSALKKSLFAKTRQPSMTEAEILKNWAEKFPKNFWKTGRFSMKKEKALENRKQNSRFARFQKYHRKNRF